MSWSHTGLCLVAEDTVEISGKNASFPMAEIRDPAPWS